MTQTSEPVDHWPEYRAEREELSAAIRASGVQPALVTTDSATRSLAEQLLVWIADDEAVARAAASGRPWRYDEKYGCVWDGTGGACANGVLNNGPHIARHDPARVLADCAAHRRIVEWCSGYVRIHTGSPGTLHPTEKDFVPGGLVHADGHVILRMLAAPYADREGFREEWRHG